MDANRFKNARIIPLTTSAVRVESIPSKPVKSFPVNVGNLKRNVEYRSKVISPSVRGQYQNEGDNREIVLNSLYPFGKKDTLLHETTHKLDETYGERRPLQPSVWETKQIEDDWRELATQQNKLKKAEREIQFIDKQYSNEPGRKLAEMKAHFAVANKQEVMYPTTDTGQNLNTLYRRGLDSGIVKRNEPQKNVFKRLVDTGIKRLNTPRKNIFQINKP